MTYNRCTHKDCECKGSGYIIKSGSRVECEGVLRARLVQYLTPFYAQASFVEGLGAAQLEGKNILCQSMEIGNFKSIVKSFLLLTGAKYQHHTVTAHDIIQAYVSTEDVETFAELTNKKLLFIYLNNDPPNRQYSEIIGTLLSKRTIKGNHTWVYTKLPISHQDFSFRYGQGLQDALGKAGGFVTIVK